MAEETTTELTITIDNERLEKLHQRAALLGLTTDELVLKTIDDLLNIAEDDFIALVQEILHNNAELYRRLA